MQSPAEPEGSKRGLGSERLSGGFGIIVLVAFI